MDRGRRVGSGISLATQNFIKKDVELLRELLFIKWNIKTIIHKAGLCDQ